MATQSGMLRTLRRSALQTSLVALMLGGGHAMAQTAAPLPNPPPVARADNSGEAGYVSAAERPAIRKGALDGYEKVGAPAVAALETPAAPPAIAVTDVEKQVLRGLLNQRKFDAALKQANDLLVKAPADAELHVIRAHALYNTGKNAEALSGYEKALSLNALSVEAVLGRADSKYRLGRLKEIPADLEDALTRIPDAVQILNILAQAHMQLKDLDAAMASANRAIAVAGSSHIGWNVRGLVHARAQRFDQAIADFNKAIEIAPKFGLAYANRGVALLRMGKPDQAEPDLVTGARTYNIKHAAVHLQALYASRVFGAVQQQASR